MADREPYWFPAKRRGWGWDMPTCWQGRAVIVGFFVFLAIGAAALLPRFGAVPFVLFALLLCGLLMAICWLKGEPPRWR